MENDTIPAPSYILLEPKTIDRRRNTFMSMCLRMSKLQVVSNLGQAIGKLQFLNEGVMVCVAVCKGGIVVPVMTWKWYVRRVLRNLL